MKTLRSSRRATPICCAVTGNAPTKSRPAKTTLVIALACCRFGTAQVNPSQTGPPDEARAYLLNQCFISEPAPPPPPPPTAAALSQLGLGLLSNAIPTVASALYSGVVGALKKAGDSKDFSASAQPTPFYLYEVSNQPAGTSPKPQPRCVVFAYGKFASATAMQPPGLASPRDNCYEVCGVPDRRDIAKCRLSPGTSATAHPRSLW